MGRGRDPSWGGCWRWHGAGSLSLRWISPLCPVSPLRGDVHGPVQENQHALLRISMATGTPPALLPVSSLLGRGDASVTEGTPRGRRGCSCDGEDNKKSRGSPPSPPPVPPPRTFAQAHPSPGGFSRFEQRVRLCKMSAKRAFFKFIYFFFVTWHEGGAAGWNFRAEPGGRSGRMAIALQVLCCCPSPYSAGARR